MITTFLIQILRSYGIQSAPELHVTFPYVTVPTHFPISIWFIRGQRVSKQKLGQNNQKLYLATKHLDETLYDDRHIR